MNKQELEAEVVRLNELLQQECAKNKSLQNTIDAMRQQEVDMAAHFRGMKTNQ